MKDQTIWWAHLETIHWTFDAFGASMAEARAAMKRGWATHAKQTGATAAWAEVKDDVRMTLTRIGGSLRDGVTLS